MHLQDVFFPVLSLLLWEGGEVVILTAFIPVRFNCSFLFSTGSVSGVLAGKGHSDLIQQRLDKSSCNKIRWLSAFWLLNGVLVKL